MEKIQKQKINIIPLGGLGEVGRNMTLLEYQDQILVIDMGLSFPEETMHGIDYVIPNITYLKEKKKNIVGAVFTHGHYDHIGAVPHIIDKVWRRNLPIYASPLTKGIIMKRQKDFPNMPPLILNDVKNGSKIKIGVFQVEFFKQNHSIPDNMGLIITTPIGRIIHTSDFKFDLHPVNDEPTDFNKLKRIGSSPTLLLMSDSTGAEQEGHSFSEEEVFKNLEIIFEKSKGKIITATFSSLLNRIQQVITLSEKYGRKVLVEGYSMKANTEISKYLGYLKSKKGTLVKKGGIRNIPDNKLTIVCTGAQGETSAALMRIVNKENKSIKLRKNDVVILSSSIVPGNERAVQFLKDNILRQGADVFHYKMMDIHAGGHGLREELKTILEIIKPRFFMPIHGQHSMLISHSKLAQSIGIPEKNIAVAENGQVLELTNSRFFISDKSVPSEPVMVDGLGVGDVGEVVLKDRQILAEDGMFVIVVIIDRKTGRVKGSPDIISRGFVYLRESKNLLKETRGKVIDIINKTTGSGNAVNLTNVKEEIRKKIGLFFLTKTQRKPMILPVIIEV
ncbi:MAG: ribonuclease J [Patescibacteria group bacterium]